MKSLLALHSLTAQRGDGLRSELIGLLLRKSAIPEVELANASDFLGSTCAGWLNVETVGPPSLLPYRECGIRFGADATVTIVLGVRDSGWADASSYFTGVLVTRLGIPRNQIRLYHTGMHPAVRRTPRRPCRALNRADMSVAVAEIADLIEQLCDRVIEQGRRLLASSRGILPADVDFEPSTGRFRIAGTDQHVDILEMAKRRIR
jgi:hypothetical protein